MEIKLQFGKIVFECTFRNRSLKIFTRCFKWKYFFEWEWPNKFKCLKCGEEIVDDGQLLRFCEPHRRDFLERWKDRLEKE